jgi:hypothetical protein
LPYGHQDRDKVRKSRAVRPDDLWGIVVTHPASPEPMEKSVTGKVVTKVTLSVEY